MDQIYSLILTLIFSLYQYLRDIELFRFIFLMSFPPFFKRRKDGAVFTFSDSWGFHAGRNKDNTGLFTMIKEVSIGKLKVKHCKFTFKGSNFNMFLNDLQFEDVGLILGAAHEGPFCLQSNKMPWNYYKSREASPETIIEMVASGNPMTVRHGLYVEDKVRLSPVEDEFLKPMSLIVISSQQISSTLNLILLILLIFLDFTRRIWYPYYLSLKSCFINSVKNFIVKFNLKRLCNFLQSFSDSFRVCEQNKDIYYVENDPIILVKLGVNIPVDFEIFKFRMGSEVGFNFDMKILDCVYNVRYWDDKDRFTIKTVNSPINLRISHNLKNERISYTKEEHREVIRMMEATATVASKISLSTIHKSDFRSCLIEQEYLSCVPVKLSGNFLISDETICLNNMESLLYNSIKAPDKVKSKAFVHNYIFYGGEIILGALYGLFNSSSARKRPAGVGNSQWKRYCSEFKQIVSDYTVITSIEKRLEFKSKVRVNKIDFSKYNLEINPIMLMENRKNLWARKLDKTSFPTKHSEGSCLKEIEAIKKGMLKTGLKKGTIERMEERIKVKENDIRLIKESVLSENCLSSPKLSRRTFRDALNNNDSSFLTVKIRLNKESCFLNNFETNSLSKRKCLKVKNLNESIHIQSYATFKKVNMEIKGEKKEEGTIPGSRNKSWVKVKSRGKIPNCPNKYKREKKEKEEQKLFEDSYYTPLSAVAEAILKEEKESLIQFKKKSRLVIVKKSRVETDFEKLNANFINFREELEMKKEVRSGVEIKVKNRIEVKNEIIDDKGKDEKNLGIGVKPVECDSEESYVDESEIAVTGSGTRNHGDKMENNDEFLNVEKEKEKKTAERFLRRQHLAESKKLAAAEKKKKKIEREEKESRLKTRFFFS